jgi:hypothetical protein
MDRNLIAFNFLFDYSIGTLWKIKEELWKKRIHRDEQYDSDRVWHPGLSIQRNRVVESYELIPILHGTSKGSNRKSIVVKGITEDRGAEKKTFFGRIFAPIEITDFLFDKRSISKNRHKPKINTEELQQLEKWMQKKGL